jgi:hypothetical protein
MPLFNQMELLDKAMMLHMAYYFISRTIWFTDIDNTPACDFRSHWLPPYNGTKLISKLLNAQIKSAVNSLRVELTRDVLRDLEKVLKTGKKNVWAPCFSVICIMCMCMEMVQIGVDRMVMYDITQKKGPNNIKKTEEICRKLEDKPMAHIFEFFHAVYKTAKAPGSNISNFYNPIRDGTKVDLGEGIDEECVQLVNEIRGIISKNR